MLEQVSVGQNRFNVPGIASDSRGVCIGRFLALHFTCIDRVVAFFAAFTAENAMDDLLTGLRIVHVETPLRTRELIVLLPVRMLTESMLSTVLAAVARGVETPATNTMSATTAARPPIRSTRLFIVALGVPALGEQASGTERDDRHQAERCGRGDQPVHGVRTTCALTRGRERRYDCVVIIVR